jgi:ribose 5-phosphate isomerase A
VRLAAAPAAPRAPRLPSRCLPPRATASGAEPDAPSRAASTFASIKRFGAAGTLSYILTEVAFWALALPGAAFGYHASTGEWLSWDTDRAQLAALAATFVTSVRFAVPLRMGVALACVPAVQRALDAAGVARSADAPAVASAAASASTPGGQSGMTPSGVVLSRPAAAPAALAAIGAAAASRVAPSSFVGLGSGRASLAFVRALGERLAAERATLTGVVGVATSEATAVVAREAGVPLAPLSAVPGGVLDLCVDGADEVDPQLNLLKGGGGNLAREKMCEWRAKELIILVGEEKLVERLGSQFPVFVEALEFGLPGVVDAVQRLGGHAERRLNADGSFFKTDDGNAYLACFFGELADPAALDTALHAVPGVVDTGIFLGLATEVLVARADGSTSSMRRQ